MIRNNQLYRVDAVTVDALEPGDRLVYVRKISLDGHPHPKRNGRQHPK